MEAIRLNRGDPKVELGNTSQNKTVVLAMKIPDAQKDEFLSDAVADRGDSGSNIAL